MFFRRFGLQDVKTILLNSILLFVVLLYVYPLKFIFSLLTQGNIIIHPDGTTVTKLSTTGEVDQLMLIYGIGFFVIYSIFLLMHMHALAKKDELRLNAIEMYNTRTAMYGNLTMMSIGALSTLFALLGIFTDLQLSSYSGLSYALIGIALSVLYRLRAKKRNKIFTSDEIQKMLQEKLVIEEKQII